MTASPRTSPPPWFDPCVIHSAVAVDKDQAAGHDANRCSVPRPFAFGTIAVRDYVDRVVIR